MNTAGPTPVQLTDTAGTGYWNDWTLVAEGAIGFGAGNACGLRSNGTAWCWKDGLGNPTNFRPAQVPSDTCGAGWSDWVNIVTGVLTSCGTRADGTTWCWGNGGNGQLGNGDTANQTCPVQVK